MLFFSHVYESEKFAKEINTTFLVLIPKKGGVEELKDFRPISLVGSVYKILAKVLANRLRKFWLDSQHAFIEGRQILDAALIANEDINSIIKQRKGGLLCKLEAMII